ncbi:hypothetical protein [Fodinicurvata halophila]|uniref:hypothetical protein n=1 Tax=Fodinicurvata halophila TaxID=1419723 RepID=UPI00362BCBFC
MPFLPSTLQGRTKLFVAIVCAMSLLAVFMIWMAGQSVGRERAAVDRQIEFRQLGQDLAAASDYLTNQARLYAVTGNREHHENYWREVEETQTRDKVVERLRELNAPQAELELIQQAQESSNGLVETEDQAMAAVAEGDMDLARSLMFGENYDSQKARIMDYVAQFQQMMNERAAAEAATARDQARLLLNTGQLMVVVLAGLMVAVLVFFFSRRVVRPVAGLSQTVRRLIDGDHAAEILPGPQGRDRRTGRRHAAVQGRDARTRTPGG